MAEPEINYGKKIDYDPLWKGPMDIERSRTDSRFLISLGLFFVFWMGISIYAYSVGDVQGWINAGLNRNKRDLSGSLLNGNNINDRTTTMGLIICGFIVLAMALSVAYIILLQWFAKAIVYTAITLICILLCLVACAGLYFYCTQGEKLEYLIPVVVATLVLIGIVCLTVACRNKISISCEVIKESSKVIMFFPSSLLFPILPTILYTLMLLFGGSTLVYLQAIPPTDKGDTPGHVYVFHLVNIFGVLWVGSFITGFAQMILSGSFATWYWTMNKQYVPNYTLLSWVKKTTQYHLGTIAFGSLILAVCQFIRLLLDFIRGRLQGSCNPFICCCFNWYKYLFGNLERILKYLNRNAYIYTAVHGTEFIESAKNAFNLLMRNIINVFVINKITDGLLILGQLLVILISTLSTFAYCNNHKFNNDEMTIALSAVAISCFVITIAFFNVLRIAIDTIFLCVLEDSERNDNSQDRPYYMSFKLKNLIIK